MENVQMTRDEMLFVIEALRFAVESESFQKRFGTMGKQTVCRVVNRLEDEFPILKS